MPKDISADRSNVASNQFLGGLPVGSGNLATSSTIDLGSLDGDQFFTVPLPSEPTRITAITTNEGTGEVAITFTSKPNSDYLIESSPDLTVWGELDDSFPASVGETTTTYTTTESLPATKKKFYRVTINPP